MAAKVIGTAGHIDHGKSSLVKCLTGTDPDRLKEEKQRGMTIDLGFAFLTDEIAIIDVPGHERFIKNMVAGTSTIDLALLVVAADDGVMPQTREHLDIMNLLGIPAGVIAVTKIDLADEEWLRAVEEEIRQTVAGTFLASAPILRTSAETGEGIEALRKTLIELAERTPSRSDQGVFWLPVDRSFTVKGYGTVVTGTVLSGQVRVGEELELLPEKRRLRVRGIQSHGRPVEKVGIGDRAALNLPNIAKEDIRRGDILATTGRIEPTRLLDVRLTLLTKAPQPIKSGKKLRLHIGTAEMKSRVKLLETSVLLPGQSALAQLYLDSPTAALFRQPFILRTFSPALTIGGGVVLDANPKPHRRSDKLAVERLKQREKFNVRELLLSHLVAPATAPLKLVELTKAIGVEEKEVVESLERLLQDGLVRRFGHYYLHQQNYLLLKERIRQLVSAFHAKEPLQRGIKKSYVAALLQSPPEVMDAALGELKTENILYEEDGVLRLADFSISLSLADRETAEKILSIFSQAPFRTPPPKILSQMIGVPLEQVQRVLQALVSMGKVLRLDMEIFLTREAVRQAEKILRSFGTEEFTVSEFRERLATSRKFAVPLLNYFDQRGITERVGELRRLRK
ncbi:MAG: selenocysteine-specific translation elongation factor [candidate division KSB1 bacterium]|nr:selenocysteine-specific translation elongation factor [candidate division KSB1 bacterium]